MLAAKCLATVVARREIAKADRDLRHILFQPLEGALDAGNFQYLALSWRDPVP